jgi:hypothetical protein
MNIEIQQILSRYSLTKDEKELTETIIYESFEALRIKITDRMAMFPDVDDHQKQKWNRH